MSPGVEVRDPALELRPRAGWFPYRYGLLLKLAGFYLLISLPTLLLVEAVLLRFEFHTFAAAVDDGALLRAMRIESRRLEATLRHGGSILEGSDGAALVARELDGWILGMERPSPTGELRSYVLLELSDQPFAAMLRPVARMSGIHNGDATRWRIDASEWASAQRDDQDGEIARGDTPDWMRRFSVPVHGLDGSTQAHLLLEIRLPMPWRKLLFKVSYEWPLLIAYLLVFSIGTILFFNRWVTGRLHRIEIAADAWRRGEFAVLIDDSAEDELGGLSRRLDRMAADLRDLVHARAEVAMLNERARLARDLHDTVKQKAFALTLQIAVVRAQLRATGADGGPALDECRKLAEEIQRELALILDELRLDGSAESFHEELHARIQAWARRSGVQTSLSLRATDRVEVGQRDTLARLLDEALANVQRHSGATTVEIELVADGDRMCLLIADNGSGMPADLGAGMGLGNMRKRAADLPGGNLTVEAGAGVRIMVTWQTVEAG